jgi:F0F1-type ATP synthase membrane subunit b/b'
MSDPIKPTEGEGTTPDPISNMKAEFNRKLSSQEQAINQLLESQKALVAQLQQTAKPATTVETDDIGDLWYSKPEVAAEKIKEKAKAEIRKEFQAEQQVTNQRNSVLSQLVSEYPELNNNNADLTKKAVEIYSQLPEDEKSRPMAYRLAVKEAAAELGVKPLSKRENQEDYFSVGGASGMPNTGTSSRRSKDELDAATAAFAQIMGVDPEKVKNRAKNRNSWNRYE